MAILAAVLTVGRSNFPYYHLINPFLPSKEYIVLLRGSLLVLDLRSSFNFTIVHTIDTLYCRIDTLPTIPLTRNTPDSHTEQFYFKGHQAVLVDDDLEHENTTRNRASPLSAFC